MASEPAAGASLMVQGSQDGLKNNIEDQTHALEAEIAATGSGEQAHFPGPAVLPEGSQETEPRTTGMSSFIASIRQSQALQEASHVPRIVEESHEHPNFTSNEALSYQQRDLERAEPIVPCLVVSSGAPDQTQNRSRTELSEGRDSMSTGYNRLLRTIRRLIRATSGTSQDEQNELLIDCLRSIAGANGEEIYRKYAMGYGRRRCYGWFVEAIFDKIVTAASTQHNGWFVGGSAILLQHLISRWVHTCHRKYFQTMFCDKTAVYLLQNIGDPSDRWLHDTLRKNLGMNPQFLDEHLALVYDGSRHRPTAGGNTYQQFCPRAWHIWATFSDQQMLQFNSLSTPPPSTSAALMYISFQRTDTDSCKLGNIDMTKSRC